MHARKKPMAEDVDYAAVATMTDGMVGAELANIVEVAAINMMRDARTEVFYLFICFFNLSYFVFLVSIIHQHIYTYVV